MVKVKQRSLVWRKFRKNRVTLVGAAIISIITILAVVGPYISPYNPNEIIMEDKLLSPRLDHWMGTDHLGRDVYSYIIFGARESIWVAVGAVIVEIVIALLIGGVAGYGGGWIDEVLMRLTDIILTLPTIVLLIVAVSMFEVRSSTIIMVVMGAMSWPWLARIVRSQFLVLKESSFVEAARSLGASHSRIIFRHILPNALSEVIVMGAMDLAWFILFQTTLTFLGLGDPTTIAWGTLIKQGKNYLRTSWWITTFPGLFIFFTALGFNLLGDGLRDAFDVKTRV